MHPPDIVEAVPERELTKPEVHALEQHERIDQAVVELVSTGTSHADGRWRKDMVEVFWIEIDGTAHVLEYKREGWVKQGEFEVDDVGNVHRAAAELSDHD